MEKCWRILAGRWINVIGPLMFANFCLLKLDSYPPPETGKQTKVLAFLMIAFQRNGSQVLEKKQFWVLDDLEAEMEFTMAKFCLFVCFK